MYLSRAVEVQPCFNRDVISELSDQATTNLLELGAWAEGERLHFDGSRPDQATAVLVTEESDADAQLLKAAIAGNSPLLKEWTARLRDARDSGADSSARLTRTFLAAIAEAPLESLNLILMTELVDLQAEDDINERNCLHEAAIYGREPILELALAKGIDANRVDVYGRVPLHYACMHGNVSMIARLLRARPQSIDRPDHDNFTPLIHSIVHRRLECVQELLAHGARIGPSSESEHVPLNLACQYGDISITRLLLERGASIVPDAEGLFPQHLVARKGGSPEILLALREHGADLDQRDKVYQWTPLFHAASEGYKDCVRVLIANGADVDLLDEKGLSAMYYATWEGHLYCMTPIASARRRSSGGSSRLGAQRSGTLVGSSRGPQPLRDADGIPSLSLPPPIIPLRRYGHNFLENKAFVQISLEAPGSEAVTFYNNSKYPAARLTISSKSSELIPRNVMLPIPEEFRMLSFQVDSLGAFTVDFDVYPTFGAKVIARPVALPSIFSAVDSSAGRCCLPLFDPRLRAIGELAFSFQVIKPFDSMPMEIAQSETYWKSTSHLDTEPSTLITGSSLSGAYVRLHVQLTADGVPVIFTRWCIDYHGIACPVGRLTLAQLTAMSGSMNPEATPSLASLQHPAQVFARLLRGVHTLEHVLASLDRRMRVNVHVLYPSAAEEQSLGLGPALNINSFADAILRVVFQHAKTTRDRGAMRAVVFSSYNVDLCTALNWKQPTCECSAIIPLGMQ